MNKLRKAFKKLGVKKGIFGDEAASVDTLLVDFAGDEMARKLHAARVMGYGGWWKPKTSEADLRRGLMVNAMEGDYVDVLNFAAMLLAREALYPNGVSESDG